jgi:hypothetical protein
MDGPPGRWDDESSLLDLSEPPRQPLVRGLRLLGFSRGLPRGHMVGTSRGGGSRGLL